MRVILTGASGFVGRPLVARLEAAGHSLVTFGRSPQTGLPASVRFAIWDPAKGPPPRDELRDADAIIHLAGEPVAQRWSEEVKRRIRDSRVESTRALVETLGSLSTRPGILVSASASGYYGDRGEEVLTESSPAGKGFLAEICAEWENAARVSQSLGLRVVIVRIGLVLGPGGGALARMLPVFRLGLGGPLGSGRQWMPWVHREDLVDLLEFALGAESVRGPINACSPNPVTNAEFTRALGRALHRPALIPVPRAAIRLLYGEMAGIVFDSQRMAPQAAQGAGFQFRHPEVYGALKDVVAAS